MFIITYNIIHKFMRYVKRFVYKTIYVHKIIFTESKVLCTQLKGEVQNFTPPFYLNIHYIFTLQKKLPVQYFLMYPSCNHLKRLDQIEFCHNQCL